MLWLNADGTPQPSQHASFFNLPVRASTEHTDPTSPTMSEEHDVLLSKISQLAGPSPHFSRSLRLKTSAQARSTDTKTNMRRLMTRPFTSISQLHIRGSMVLFFFCLTILLLTVQRRYEAMDGIGRRMEPSLLEAGLVEGGLLWLLTTTGLLCSTTSILARCRPPMFPQRIAEVGWPSEIDTCSSSVPPCMTSKSRLERRPCKRVCRKDCGGVKKEKSRNSRLS